MTDRVEIERRCGMIMGARHGHMTLTLSLIHISEPTRP